MIEPVIDSAPQDWEHITLGELCHRGGGDIQTGPFGTQLHAADYVSAGIPVVMPQSIGDNVILAGRVARIGPEDADHGPGEFDVYVRMSPSGPPAPACRAWA